MIIIVAAYNNSNDLEMIIKRCQDHEAGDLTKAISFSTAITLMMPIKPMLAKKVSSLEEIFTKSPSGIYSEIKYDGERIQIHIDENHSFKCFSRRLKPIPEWKVKGVLPYIIQAAPNVQSVILDGEILLMDSTTRKPLPFGTLNVHKKNNFQNSSICVVLFDILYLNGEVLLNEPIEKRRKLLSSTVKVSFFEL